MIGDDKPSSEDELLSSEVERTLPTTFRIAVAGRGDVVGEMVKSKMREKLENHTRRIASVYPAITSLQDVFFADERILYGFLISGATVKKIPSIELFDKDPMKVTKREFGADRLYDVDLALFTTDDVSADDEKLRLIESLHKKIPPIPAYASWQFDLGQDSMKSERQVAEILSRIERVEQLEEAERDSSLTALKKLRIPGGIFYNKDDTEGVLIYRRQRGKTPFDENFDTFQSRYGLPRSLDDYLNQTVKPYLARAFREFPQVRETAMQVHTQHADFFRGL